MPLFPGGFSPGDFTPGPVPMHGIASRGDLPLPFSFVVAGAALALIVSFVVLLFAWRRPRFAAVGGRPVPGLQRIVDNRGVRLGASLLVLALYLWVGLALVAGQDRLTNPAFGFVFVWVWVGVVPVSLLFGPIWRATNPLRTIHAGLTSLARVDPDDGLASLPSRLGVWPAAAGLFAFAWLELVQPDRTTLSVLRLWVLAWLLILILGAVIFGRRWIGAADPFETYASTVAQLSPWHRVSGQLRLVNPLAGLNAWTPPPGTPAVVAVLLGSTAFDSFANTTWWISTVQDSNVSPVIWETGGLLIMIVIIFATFCAAAAWMGRYLARGRPEGDQRVGAVELPRMMAGSLVPIVIGYAIAHYFTLLVVEGQRTALALSDPLGLGWDVFGTAEGGVDARIFEQPTLIAAIQLLAIIGGHILGIVSAHEKSVSLLAPDRALAGQWPMLVVMVFYTCSGLVLLFSP
ncbi:MAG TPA: hypothetical protein VIT42_19630 [Microlunatus sp.]